MSTSSHVRRIDEYYDEEQYAEIEEEDLGPHSDSMDFIQRTPWWIISIIFHAAFLIMAAMWTISSNSEKDEFSIFEMNVKKFKKPEYDPTLKRDIKRSNKEVKDEVQVENPIITKEDLEIDEMETPDDMEREHKAKGRQEAMSTIELQGDGWVGVFGVGGGGSGAYGWRDGGGKKRAIGRFGGGAATESAVLAALRWFKRHQAADGSWSFEHYTKECKENPACQATGKYATHGGLDQKSMSNAATGFALLCFLGAGHTQKAGQFRQQVANGLSYLQTSQGAEGSFAKNNYCHSITTMAVAEAYGMTKTPLLKDVAQKAVNVLQSRQNEYAGWDYMKPTGRNDTSVTGWAIMAMKSAKSSGLDIGNAFEGAAKHVEKVTPEIKGDSYPTMGDVEYVWYSNKGGKGGHKNSRLTAIGCLIRVFIGEDTTGRVLRAHGNRLLEQLPKPGKTDYYRTYYATLAMFQMGGNYWKKWNEKMKKVLLDKQCRGGCADGSWDPFDADKYGAQRAGRVFVTAVGCLSLEVYYRYLPVAMLK
ncbi:prenyltransferase/squalene oxidase repeat-containing protein [Planctomycetota bacterium]